MSMNSQTPKDHKTPGRISAFLDRLSTSNLVFVVAAIFAVDLIVPDMVPFIDEVVLGVLTILLTRWRSNANRRAAESDSANSTGDDYEKPPPKNVTPS